MRKAHERCTRWPPGPRASEERRSAGPELITVFVRRGVSRAPGNDGGGARSPLKRPSSTGSGGGGVFRSVFFLPLPSSSCPPGQAAAARFSNLNAPTEVQHTISLGQEKYLGISRVKIRGRRRPSTYGGGGDNFCASAGGRRPAEEQHPGRRV